MKYLSWILVIVALLLTCSANAVQGRHVDKPDEGGSTDGQEPLKYLDVPVGRQGAPSAEEQDDRSVSLSNRDGAVILEAAQARGPFSDLLPHVGSALYRNAVRRVLVKPMIKGMKRLVPPSAISYVKESLGNRRFFQKVTPHVQPVVSSYSYNKFEQGIFWTLKKSYTMVRDNFFEFEDEERRSKSK